MTNPRAPILDMNSSSCPISGQLSELPKFVLPTNGDIIRYWRFFVAKKDQMRKDKCKAIATDVCAIWKMASIPALELRSIERKVNDLITKLRKFSEISKTR